MLVTLHLTPRAVWEAQRDRPTYVPESFADEGFIHCTDGEDNLVAVGNRYYANDSREMVCLVIDVERIQPEIRYEDPEAIYPHIYGELNLDAVTEVRRVIRRDGTFLRLGDAIDR